MVTKTMKWLLSILLIAQSAFAGFPPGYPTMQASKSFHLYEDWVSAGSAGTTGWSATAVSGGTTTTNSGSQQGNVPGVVALSTGTSSASGSIALSEGFNQLFFGGGPATIEERIWFDTLSTSSQEYAARVGCLDTSTADATDGVYFIYDRTTSVNWIMATANNSTRTETATSTPVAISTWYKLKSIVNAAATNVDYYINDVLVGSITGNIPKTSSRLCAPTLQIVKSVGTGTAGIMTVDYFEMLQIFTTSR